MNPTTHELVERVRREHFGDARTTLAEIEIMQQRNDVRLRGVVLDRTGADAFVAALRKQAPSLNWRDEMIPLVTGPDYSWALIPWPVADVRREPMPRSERLSQAIFGEPVEVLRQQRDWSFVRLPDGYLGWMHNAPLWHCSAEQAAAYQEHTTHVVIHAALPCYADGTGRPEQQQLLLPFGSRVLVESDHGPFARVRLPNQMVRWVPAIGLLPRAHLPPASRDGLRTIVKWVNSMIGVPYLWGGRTPFGYDCSGLVQSVFGAVGIHLHRDADQQALNGSDVDPGSITFGDLLFFDSWSDTAPLGLREIGHVGIALDDGDFLHASFSTGGVTCGSFNERSPAFLPGFREHLICARRLLQA